MGLFKYVQNVAPYSDASGYGAVATVEHVEGEGVRLQIEMHYHMSVEQWPALREAIDRMVKLAEQHPDT